MTTVIYPVRRLLLNPYPVLNPPERELVNMVQVRNMYRQQTKRVLPGTAGKRPPIGDPYLFGIYSNESLTPSQRRDALRNYYSSPNHNPSSVAFQKKAAALLRKRQKALSLVERYFKPTVHYVDSGEFTDEMAFVEGSANLVVSANPWASRVHRVTHVLPRFTVYHSGIAGGFYSTSYPSSPPVQNRLLSEIKGTGLNLAMMLAEYRQTSAMFADAGSRLLKFYRKLRRGQIPNAQAFKRYLSDGSVVNDWLVYRYGVTPLLHDLIGIDAWLSGEYINPLIKRFSIYEGRRKSEVKRAQSTFNPGTSARFTAIDKYDVKSKQVAWVEFDHTVFRTFSQLGFENPLLLTWELIPYSFVVDWFIQVGSYLESLDALKGVKRIAITRSVISKSELWMGSNHAGTGKRYTRTVLTPGAISQLTYKPSLSVKRVIDAVALIKQAHKR